MVGRQLRHRQQDVAQLVHVDAGQPAQRAEQALRAELGHERAGVRVVERRQGEGDVGDRLGEDAAEAEGDDGAELLVAAHADEQFALVRHELLDEHALVRPSGRPVDDAVVGGAGGGRVPDVELDEAEVALVLDVGPERLQDGGPAERLDCGRRPLRVVDDGAGGRRYPVHREEGLGLPLVERRPPCVERPADQVATGSAHGAFPLGVARTSRLPTSLAGQRSSARSRPFLAGG